MSVERAGGMSTADSVVRARAAVTADDTSYPSGADQAGSITVPPWARGALTHVLVFARGSGVGVACRVAIYGYEPVTARWYTLAQLNSGATITRTTKTTVANGNDITYAESFSHISAYSRLYALIDATASIAAGGIDVLFGFEGP